MAVSRWLKRNHKNPAHTRLSRLRSCTLIRLPIFFFFCPFQKAISILPPPALTAKSSPPTPPPKTDLSSCFRNRTRKRSRKYLLHSCDCLSLNARCAFCCFFVLCGNSIALNIKLNTWIQHQPPRTPRAKPFSWLYLSGRQLVAALSLGSLGVAVNQHPLELKLQKGGDVSVHRNWRSVCVPCSNVFFFPQLRINHFKSALIMSWEGMEEKAISSAGYYSKSGVTNTVLQEPHGSPAGQF